MSRSDKVTERIDLMVGCNIRTARMCNGLTTMELASKIGVTHQQLDKYEKSTNRVSAGRLGVIAKSLNKPVSFFFEEVKEDDVPRKQAIIYGLSKEFLKLKKEHQQVVNILIKVLAESENDKKGKIPTPIYN